MLSVEIYKCRRLLAIIKTDLTIPFYIDTSFNQINMTLACSVLNPYALPVICSY
jgi:hypothetical protein